MIVISKAEQKEIRKLLPQAAIQRTRHRAYLVISNAAIDALRRVRHQEARTSDYSSFKYGRAVTSKTRHSASESV